MNIAILLSGSGVFDGSEIQETVFSMLAIAKHGANYQCIAPDVAQHHVINHLTGEEMQETRNVLTESARIARGEVKSLTNLNLDEFDALVIPGGFGTAKNHTKWAFNGPNEDMNQEVKALIQHFVSAKKPIAALCMAPTTVAKALEQHQAPVNLTVGNDHDSPYDITAISSGITQTGNQVQNTSINEICIDQKHHIISAPCYMLNASITEINTNIETAIDALFELIKK